jgi:hypothetical protein
LVALGYRTLDHIRREYRLQASGQFVDYLLIAGDQRVVVEAKPIGVEFSAKDAAQLVGYCAQEGIRWALLTNGLRWEVFDIELPGNWETKRIADIDLGAASKTQSLAEALVPLSHFALDTLRPDDSALRAWAHEERARLHLDRLLNDPASSVVAAVAAEMAKVGIELELDDVVTMLRRGTTRPTEPVRPPGPGSGQTPDESAAYYIFPAGAYAGFASLDHLRPWLDHDFWGVRQSTAHRARLKAGDQCCFYATKVGVVARAMIRGPATQQVGQLEWPGPNEFSQNVYKVPLADICWIDTPVELDPKLRARLNAFQGKDPSRPWSWFVQSTCRVTEHDFQLLTSQSR